MNLNQEIYTCSATKAQVKLSFTGRHLLQNLREAITFAVSAGDYDADNKAISRARFKLAVYMGGLEFRAFLEEDVFTKDLSKVPYGDLLEELNRRLSK